METSFGFGGHHTNGIGKSGDPQYTVTANHQHFVYDARENGDGETVCTLTGDHQNLVTDYTALCIGNGQANQSVSDKAGALNTMHDQQAVFTFAQNQLGEVRCNSFSGTLNTNSNASGRNAPLVCTMVLNDQGGSVMDVSNENTATLRAQSHGHEPAVMNQSVVRRLTPLECERLQGYPDGWTDIGEWVDSKGKKHKPADSPRYKALGNSIALPFWFWLLRRISAQYYRPARLGSLFDGIGGFPLCWERCNGKGTALWASEIEEFPIAVTKKRFGD
jgi:DNA (cytosine-5)-methyltransferase 1